MPLLTALIVAAGIGVGQGAASEPPRAEPTGPEIMFEIRDLAMASPDWRGDLQPELVPVAREDGVAAWAVGREGMRRLMEAQQSDRRSAILVAPRLTARAGEPVRMENGEKVEYVAHLKRISDGPPNQGTSIAFQPELAEILDGVRVDLTETRLKGSAVYARVVVRSNTVLSLLTTTYGESVGPAEADPEVERASFLPKLKHDGPQRASIRGTIQVPEVASRRIEGDWLIPADGAIVVSMGPNSQARIGRKPYGEQAGGLGRPFGGHGEKRGYEERVICITAYPKPASVSAAPSTYPPRP